MKKIVFLFLFAVAGLCGWFWWTHHDTSDEPTGEPSATASVEVTPLAQKEIAQTVEAIGVVAAAPSGEQVVAATFDGVVRRVAVSVGRSVEPGELLVELAPSPDAQLALASARSAATLAEKVLTDTQHRFELNLATRPELQSAEQAAGDARAKLASLEARGAAGDGRIVAAKGGVVSKVDATAGAWIAAGASLVTLVDKDALEVRLGLEAKSAATVAAGQPVEVISVMRPEAHPVETTVRDVGRTLDASTGAIEARAALPADASLLLGEHVRATIEVQRKTTLVVPRVALLPEEDHTVMFTVKDNKATRHAVQTGIASGDLVEVIGADLRAGDQVVTLGNYELDDGMAVRIAAPQNAPQAASTEAKQP